MLKCAECGRRARKHHIVFKGCNTIIVYLPINQALLCKECHKKIHVDKKMDIKYKVSLQEKLELLFPNEYYMNSDIKNILKLKGYQLNTLANAVSENAGVYYKNDIIKYLMGGRIYH